MVYREYNAQWLAHTKCLICAESFSVPFHFLGEKQTHQLKEGTGIDLIPLCSWSGYRPWNRLPLMWNNDQA